MIALIKLNKIEKIGIYINKDKKKIEQIKEETGADYIINGWIYNLDWTPCPLVKADGVWQSQKPYTDWGYSWTTNDIVMTPDDRGQNYLSGICFANPVEGSNVKMNVQPAMAGSRQRTAIGVVNGKYLALYCTQENKTVEQVKQEMLNSGCNTGIILDGGGSTQCIFDGICTLKSSRIVQHLIYVKMKDMGKILADTARKEIGVGEPAGDDKYIAWFNNKFKTNYSYDTHWGTIFVCWCVDQAGIGFDTIPASVSSTDMMTMMKEDGIFKPKDGYSPVVGDIVFFNWSGKTNIANNVGVVCSVDANNVDVVRGNDENNAVGMEKYGKNDSKIIGYGHWDI